MYFEYNLTIEESSGQRDGYISFYFIFGFILKMKEIEFFDSLNVDERGK